MLILLPATVYGQQSPGNTPRAVETQMRNVVYHFTDKISLHIRALRGQLTPTNGNLPVFDDKNSFVLKIFSAEITITPASLANVLNSYVFAKSDAPLKAISVEIDRDRLKIKGKLHSKGDIPFETDGQISASEDGKIRLHAVKVKALHLPVKGMMDLLGIDIADLIKTGKVQGVTAEKDDLILDLAKLLPPPHITGTLTTVRLEPNEIVQVFGDPSASADMHVPFANYMAYRGNQLRFGKLTMSDTDMILIDMNPGDPFDFYLDHYKEQLVAGYTKETPTFGLRVFMRDYNKLRQNKHITRGDSLADSGDIPTTVVRIVASVKGVSPDSIRLDTTFEELGVDSLDRINILFDVESEFNIDIPDEEARSINSIDEMIVHLADYLRHEESRGV